MNARCHFYVRIRERAGFRYEPVSLHSPSGAGELVTDTAPLVGDRIHLWGQSEETRGTFVVLARDWTYPSFGSAHWPYSERVPLQGPLVDIIVEPAEGLFVDEVVAAEEGKR